MRQLFANLAFACILIIGCVGSPAPAQTVNDLDAPVKPDTRVTYLDLLRTILPDIKMEWEDSVGQSIVYHTIPIRSQYQTHGETEDSFKVSLDQISINNHWWIGDPRYARLLMFIKFNLGNWSDVGVLALFQCAPKPRLIDCVNVSADRETWLLGKPFPPPQLRINPVDHAVLIGNSHHNSGQGYLIITAFAVVRNRIRPIFEIDLLNWRETREVDDDRIETYDYDETPTIAAANEIANGYYNVFVQVKLVKTVESEDPNDDTMPHKKKRRVRYYKDILVWNPAKMNYRSTTGALTRLSRFNQAHY
jgi:hypothetical protein